MKKPYYITFGQRSPFRNGWVVIMASGQKEAQEEAEICFGQHYSMCYDEDKFHSAREHFNRGQIGETIEGL
jgi:hypothetical protein